LRSVAEAMIRDELGDCHSVTWRRHSGRQGELAPTAILIEVISLIDAGNKSHEAPVHTENPILAMKSQFSDDAAPISSSN
jgi:hypothetical protein